MAKISTNSGLRILAGAGVGLLLLLLLMVGYAIYQHVTSASAEVSALPTPATSPVPPAEAALEAKGPVFDLVRVTPEGSSVVAGHAAPGQEVNIMLDGMPVAAALADQKGDFVALLELPAISTAQVLSLSSADVDSEAVVSEQQVIVAPVLQAQPEKAVPEKEEKQPEVAEAKPANIQPEGAVVPSDVANVTPAPAPGQGGMTPPPASDPLPKVAPLQKPDLAAATAPTLPQITTPKQARKAAPETPAVPAEQDNAIAPAVLLAGQTGVRVLQPAQGEGAPQIGHVVIDAISYDTRGQVQLAGRGKQSSHVRIYLDNTPIQTAPISPQGVWNTDLPDIGAGIYTLRVDQLDAQGAVMSRTETPFKREEASVLQKASVAVDPAQSISSVTVQPGATLWAIARDHYGAGLLYVKVFDANRAEIRDPDLIYPGQVFTVPD